MIASEHRCNLYPRDPNARFIGASRGNPKIYKGAAATFSFQMLDKTTGVDAVLGVSGIATLYFILWSSSAVLVSKSLAGAALVDCTLEQWNAGTHQNAQFTLTGVETNQTAGQYNATVYAYTDTSPTYPVVVGVGTIDIEDVKLTAAAPSPPAAANWQDLVSAALANCVKYGWNPRGMWLGTVNEAGDKGHKIFTDDNGVFQNEPTDNPS
jgi:hypothetical protein